MFLNTSNRIIPGNIPYNSIFLIFFQGSFSLIIEAWHSDNRTEGKRKIFKSIKCLNKLFLNRGYKAFCV